MEKIWLKSYPKQVAPEIDLTQYSSVLDILEQANKKFAKQKAFTNMGVTHTYEQVWKESDAFAAFLQKKLNLKKGDRIAIQLPNVLQYPVVLFGAIKAGLIVVNTNPLYTSPEMLHQFKDSGAKAIVILANAASHLEKIIKQTNIDHVIVSEVGDAFPLVKRVLVNSVIKFVKKMVPAYILPGAYSYNTAVEIGHSLKRDPVVLKAQDTCFLQYTGGTTGVSKGAVLSHENIIANMLQIFEWMKPSLKEGEEIVITPLPLYHIFALTVNCMALMAYGAHNILITNPRDIGGFIKELTQWKFTVNTGLNTLFNALLHHPDFHKVDFSACKLSLAGGMALQPTVTREWQKVTKSKIVEGYGLTEASPVVTCNPIDGTDEIGTIGLPIPSTDIRIVDDNGNDVAMGEPGELWAKGPQVMKGYWNREDETAKTLTTDGWLKTGDIATIQPNGFVKIVDRKKDMILVSGFNVYPNEIEDVMMTHPAVKEVAAIGEPDDKSGEVVKIVVVKKAPVTEAELIAHAKQNLTSYKVPKIVEFREELPKTNVGKILRRQLRSQEKPA